MATAASKAAPKAAAAKAAAKAKATCSHRSVDGKSVFARGLGERDCTKPRRDAKSSYCVAHEKEAADYRKARAATRAAASPKPAKAKAAPKPKSAAKNGGGSLRLVKPPAPPRVAHPRVQQPQAVAALVSVEEPKS